MEERLVLNYLCRFNYRICISTVTLISIFYISPFFDAITGFLIGKGVFSTNSPFSPSQLFRFTITLVMLCQLSGKQLIISSVILLGLIAVELFAFINYTYIGGLLSGIIASYKITFILILYYTLHNYLKNNIITTTKLIKFCVFSSVIYSIIIVISDVLGISFGSYGEGIGSKGIFASANGLGIFIGVGSLLSLYIYEKTQKKIYLFYILLFCYVLINLMSKAAFIGIIFTILLYFYYQSTNKKIIIGSIAALLIAIFSSQIIEFINTASEIVVFRWNNTNNLSDFLMSGRTNYIETAIEKYNISGLLIYRLLIGGGYFMSFRNPDKSNFWESSSSFLEAELFDMFFMWGIVGLIIFIFIWIRAFITLSRSKRQYNLILKSVLLMLFIHSSIAGHVLFNGMSVIALSTIFAISFSKKIKYESTIPIKTDII